MGRVSATVGAGAALARDPRLVPGHLGLRRLSKSAFDGWATSHVPRWWEYPWVLREVRRRGGGGVAADFGAGKSPVPLGLARLGYRTVVVDPDTLQGRYGNEWEYIDYNRWGIETIKAGMEDRVFEPGSLDVAVSVSVIEHLPAEARRRGLRQIHESLKPGGLAVFSLDLLADGVHLWNRVVEEIEPTTEHGTMPEFLDECRAAGFRLVVRERCPIRLPDLRVEAVVLLKDGEQP